MLDDKYRIERLLATGGMGAVYLGTHTRLRKRVAIKVLNPQLSTASMVERFHREAITASLIGHEGIAQVTDLGTSRDGEPFLVMEYLEGESLASRLAARGPLGIEDACELGCSILSPLSAAHGAGIIHRDLKPDNVFLVRRSRGEVVKLLDFGISRASGLDPQFRLTMTGLVLGTPYYMSPEQARGESEITPAADLYAFGVMLYEMLVGDVPIRADNYNQLMYRVMIGDFARPRERRPDLPDELERVILQAMAHDPAQRPATATSLEQALLAFCRPGFADHPTGTRPSPIPVKIGDRSSDAAVVAAFAGPTVLDHSPPTPRPHAGDAAPVRLVEPLATQPDVGDDAAPAAMPGATQASRWSRVARVLTGIVIVFAGAAIARGVVIAYVDGRSEAVAPARAPRVPVAAARTPPVLAVAQPASAQAPAVEPAPREATTITLRLAITPADATVMLDGTRVRGGEVVVPRDASPHQLRITASGHLDYEDTISFDESQRLVVQLTRTAGPRRGRDRRDARGDRARGSEQAAPAAPIDRPAPPAAPPPLDRAERIEIQSPYR